MSIEYEQYFQQIQDGITAHKRDYEPIEKDGLNINIYRYWWDDETPNEVFNSLLIRREGTYEGVIFDEVEIIGSGRDEESHTAVKWVAKSIATIADMKQTYPNSHYTCRFSPADPKAAEKLALFNQVYNDKFVTP